MSVTVSRLEADRAALQTALRYRYAHTNPTVPRYFEVVTELHSKQKMIIITCFAKQVIMPASIKRS